MPAYRKCKSCPARIKVRQSGTWNEFGRRGRKLQLSFPGSAWERTTREAPPREAEPRAYRVPRQSLGTRTRARKGGAVHCPARRHSFENRLRPRCEENPRPATLAL